ncbi:MAG: BCCT family transporter [Bacillota bacterium]|nr:BCCT family transporter [Bacillota bacterium]
MIKQIKTNNKIDYKVLCWGGGICLLFVLWAIIWPEKASSTFNLWLAFFTTKFGWLYLLIVSGFVIFLIWLCCSKYGSIVLGKDGEKPEYSTLSWFFMLFAAGMGIGLVFWSVAEPMSHYLTPPSGEGRTIESAELAMRYSFMHWGLHPWACFGIVGLPLAYFQFRKNKPALLSSCLIPLIGEKRADGALGSLVNILAVFATVFGVATSLGLGAMQIGSGISYVFGISYNNAMLVLIIITVTLLFIISSVSGINRGIRLLSNFNMAVAAILLTFVLILGPTLFLTNFFTSTLGNYLQNIISVSFWTDPFNTNSGWLGSWTIFYWAWWISWGPFVGGFIARISRGRTIRQFVIATLICPVILSFIYMSIMGGTAIYMDMQGSDTVAQAMEENVSYALFALLETFPGAAAISLLAIILISTFFITSADSSTFVCAMMTSHGVQTPPKFLRVFWGTAESLVAIVLLLAGGLTSLQTASIVGAFPFMIICIFILIAFIMALQKDEYIVAKEKQKAAFMSRESIK